MSGPEILVLGARGNVARALGELGVAGPFRLRCVGRNRCDLTQPGAIERLMERLEPAAVINCAAYTAVDRAEAEPERCFELNAHVPGRIAALCERARLPFIHLSTDYVFDGRSRRPYREDDEIAPLSAYGRSKAQGEAAVREALSAHIILRTSWVYAKRGSNFLQTMLRLAGERRELSIVDDQIGSPTFADDLAGAIAVLAKSAISDPASLTWGTYHAAGRGQTSWFGFAEEIFRLHCRARDMPHLTPIATRDYPTPAPRPAYSVLDTTLLARTFALQLADWRDGVRRCLAACPAKAAPANVVR